MTTTSNFNPVSRKRGFTLIELIIVMAIIAIIAAFAYPSYIDQVRATNRADCTGGLASLANAMERHYSINGSYLGAAAGGANTGAPGIFDTTCPLDGGNATYNLTIQAATVSTYTLNATPVNNQANDRCGTLVITSTGAKSVAAAAAGVTWQECWR